MATEPKNNKHTPKKAVKKDTRVKSTTKKTPVKKNPPPKKQVRKTKQTKAGIDICGIESKKFADIYQDIFNLVYKCAPSFREIDDLLGELKKMNLPNVGHLNNAMSSYNKGVDGLDKMLNELGEILPPDTSSVNTTKISRPKEYVIHG